METRIVARTARCLSESGFGTLRFNFRGVGQSEGVWDQGRGERLDLGAALDYAVGRLPDAQVSVFGFSFGALMALEVGIPDARVESLAIVAPPVRLFSDEVIARVPKPMLVVGAGRDEIVEPGSLRDWAENVKGPSDFRMFDEADHLFSSQSDEVAQIVTHFLRQA
jgi:alpha/beta superfamily hydrolase